MVLFSKCVYYLGDMFATYDYCIMVSGLNMHIKLSGLMFQVFLLPRMMVLFLVILLCNTVFIVSINSVLLSSDSTVCISK